MSHSDDLYDDQHIEFLEALWGDGYLSPGGPEEVAKLLEGVELAGRSVVDIGCGSGGVTVALAAEHQAASVVGVDVEDPVCAAARRRVEGAGLRDRIEIRRVIPGPLPFADESIDVVFSKDSIVHIPDKATLAYDVFRVLVSGGWFVASDWLTSHDGDPSPEMQHYLAMEDLDFGMASPAAYEAALADAGFVDISFDNRNRWYLDEAKRELARLQGPERPVFDKAVGADEIDSQIDTWEAMIVVLETGEHCPHHFRARKP